MIKKIGKKNKKHSRPEDIIPTVSRTGMLTIGNIGAIGSEISRVGVTLGEMANVLNVGMPNKEIFDGYRNILGTQNTILKSVNDMQEKFAPAISELKVTTDKINSILSPITGTIVDLGLNMANANKLFEGGLIKESNFLDLQKLSSISFEAIKEQQSCLIDGFKKMSVLGDLIGSSSVSAIQMTTAGLDAMVRATPTFPLNIDLPSLKTIRDNYLFSEPEIIEEQNKLDDILKKINPELVEIRRGCWKTFNAKKPDYIRQASSSMRGLVDELLRNIVPSKFPTRKDRIYYVVDYDSKKAVHLERMAKAFLETYANLSAWDHKPIKNDEFVRGVFITVEGHIISLLSERRK